MDRETRFMRRILLSVVIGLGFTVPTTVAVIGSSSQSAFATTSSVSSVACKTLVGTASGNVTISHCKPHNAAYLSATGATTALATTGSVTWTPSNKKTKVSSTFTSPGQGACALGSTEEDASGTVISQSVNNTYTEVGSAVSARVCVDASGNITLVPGTKAVL